MQAVNAGMVRGAAWNVLFKITDRGIGLASTVVLVRLLVPADFGLVALATSLVALLALFGAFGFDIALIQNPDAQRSHFDTVWTLNVVCGLALALVLVLVATPVARFYEDSRLVEVILGLAAARAISGFENVGLVALRKEMAFDQEFRYSLYKRLATTFFATLPLAFVWRNYWALVGGAIAASCIGVVLSYRLHPYRPRLSLAAARELFGFSRWLQISNIVSFVSGRAADFIIGRAAGMSALGTFSIAKEISNLASAELAMPVHRGVFPGYAKLARDLAQLKQAYLKVASILLLVTLPGAVGVALLAQPVVFVFLGGGWSDAIPVIRILAINGVLVVSLSTAAYVYLALGIPRHTTTVTAIYGLVSVLMMLLLVPRLGIEGAALALLGGSLATVPVNFRLISQAVNVTLLDIGLLAWRPVTATLVMAAALVTARPFWDSGGTFAGHAIDLVTSAGLGAAVYSATVILLWRLARRPDGAEAFALQQLKGLLPAARRIRDG